MNNNQFLNQRWRNVKILFVIFLIAVVSQDVIREVFVFQQEADMIVAELDRDIHIEAEKNVTQVASDFRFVIDNLDEDLLRHSEENIAGLFFAANTFTLLNPTFDETEITDGLAIITSEYSELDERHNYYLYDLNGTVHYNGDTASFTPTNMVLEEDYVGNKYIEEFIAGFEKENVVSVPYYNLEDDVLVSFVLYGKRIEGTNLVIANVVNLELYSLERRSHILETLEEKYGSHTDNLFIMDTNGTILYHTNELYVGLDQTTEDSVLKSFLTEVLAFTETTSSGHKELTLYNKDNEIDDTVSYIEVINEWNIIVVSSISQAKYNDIIENYTDANYGLMLTVKIPTYIVLVTLSIYIFSYLNTTIKKSQIIVQEDEKLYRKFANLTSEIIIITTKQGEIVFTNTLGKKTIFGKRDIKTKIFFDQILVEEEGYYILYGYSEDFFVKFVTESIEYNHQNAELFIITDVTEKIKTERKLEALSLVDELTKLGNRRMMVREYNEIVLPHVKTGKEAYLVMLDLDDFKPANDLYGHSYGDHVLKNISSVFMNNKDTNTLIYRIGGDEFAMIFLNNTKKQVLEKLQKLQKEVEEYPYTKEIDVSFSAGVAVMKVNDKRRRFSDYYDNADKKLYKSKKEGKRTINM